MKAIILSIMYLITTIITAIIIIKQEDEETSLMEMFLYLIQTIVLFSFIINCVK